MEGERHPIGLPVVLDAMRAIVWGVADAIMEGEDVTGLDEFTVRQ